MTDPYPPHRSVSAAEARGADREASEIFGIPSLVLMEHAGRGLAVLVASQLQSGQHVTVVCGPGNNGGDGYACARFLHGFGVRVRVIRCAATTPRGADARLEHDLVARELPIAVADGLEDESDFVQAISGCRVIVDALFGIGVTRALDTPYPRWIALMNSAPCLRIAVDVPSGLDSDTGALRPVAVRADVTAAMGFRKRGCDSPAGAASAGRIVEIDIGLPAAIHRRFLADASRLEA